MPYNILHDIGAPARPLNDEEYGEVRTAFEMGSELYANNLVDVEVPYPVVVRNHVEGQINDGRFNITSTVGYALGVLKERYGYAEERYSGNMLWNEISVAGVAAFREGLIYGSRGAQNSRRLSISQLADLTTEAFAEAGLPFSGNHGLLGHLGGMHAVDLRRRVAV